MALNEPDQSRLVKFVEGLPGGPWLLEGDESKQLWKAPVGQQLAGAMIFAIGGSIGLVLALFQLSLEGLATSLALLAAAAGLWRWTVHDVQDWIRLKQKFDL